MAQVKHEALPKVRFTQRLASLDGRRNAGPTVGQSLWFNIIVQLKGVQEEFGQTCGWLTHLTGTYMRPWRGPSKLHQLSFRIPALLLGQLNHLLLRDTDQKLVEELFLGQGRRKPDRNLYPLQLPPFIFMHLLISNACAWMWVRSTKLFCKDLEPC